MFLNVLAARPTSSKTVSAIPERKEQADSSFEVTRVRSRSKVHTDLDCKRNSSPHDNPMEHPQFGAPSSNSYYVSSSQFTSKDVEEFKRISLQSASVTKSECSSSSHISCPDPPHMNVSPATYVQRLHEGSPASEHSLEILDQKLYQLSGSYQQSRDASDKFQAGTSVEVDSAETDADYDSHAYDGDTETLVQNESAKVVQATSDNKTSKLEESWEEFYKSPVKKISVEESYRKIQRLESINRDMREEAILKAFNGSEDDKENSEALEIIQGGHSDCAERIYDADIELSEPEGINVESGLNMDDSASKGSKIRESISDNIRAEKYGSGGTDELLDLSQKLLDELGIKEKGDVDDPRETVHIEEKVKVCLDEDDSDEIEITNNKKKKKFHRKSSEDQLKPQLCLSSPNPEGSGPELSDAVADKVDQIRTLENPDYLRKYRFSLPATMTDKCSKQGTERKLVLVPNISEIEPSRENLFRSPYSTETNLYEGTSEEKLPDEGSACQNNLSSDKKESAQSFEGRQSGRLSGDEIDGEENVAILRYIKCFSLQLPKTLSKICVDNG